MAVDGDPNAAKAMNALEAIPGISTPEGLASVICPAAPRRRGVAHFVDPSTPNSDRNL